MLLETARAIVLATLEPAPTLVLDERQSPAEVHTSLVRFLTSVARGPWWTQLDPNPEHPEWGAKVVHVVYRPKTRNSPSIFSVSAFPSSHTVPLRVGAGAGEVARVADRLLAKASLSG